MTCCKEVLKNYLDISAPDVLYHYTKRSTLGLINDKREFWMNPFYGMNDRADCRYLLDEFKNWLDRLDKNEHKYQDSSQYARIISDLKQLADDFLTHIIGKEYNIYIGSFSEIYDDPDMWEKYATEKDAGDGVCAGFRLKECYGLPQFLDIDADSISSALLKVCYEQEVMFNLFEYMLKICVNAEPSLSGKAYNQAKQEVNELIIACSPMFKAPRHNRDKEWRLVTLQLLSTIPTGPSAKTFKFDLSRKGTLFPDGYIDKVYVQKDIGPTPIPMLALEFGINERSLKPISLDLMKTSSNR